MVTSVGQTVRTSNVTVNRTARIRHQCRKTTVLSCHRCLINTGVEKNEQHLNKEYNFDQQMFPSKSKCLYSSNCLHLSKCTVPIGQRDLSIRTERIRHLCRKSAVLSCHRCLKTLSSKNKHQFNLYYNFNHQMSVSKSKFWYSNNC